jgi:hypothetical protein
MLQSARKALTEVSELMQKDKKNESGFAASSLFEMIFFCSSHYCVFCFPVSILAGRVKILKRPYLVVVSASIKD